MAQRQGYSLDHSEFDEFLFAFVGKEKSGLELTVLSALARLGLDPWGEAARLSELSKEAAEGALTTTIAKLPGGDWKVSDSQSIAVRLVNCLPRRGSLSARPPNGTGIEDQKPTSEVRQWPVWVAFAAVVLITIFSLHAD